MPANSPIWPIKTKKKPPWIHLHITSEIKTESAAQAAPEVRSNSPARIEEL
jgi:hypothetical protein